MANNMFGKKDTLTDAMDGFWGRNDAPQIVGPQVDNTPQDIIQQTQVRSIGIAQSPRYDVVKDNIDRATYGHDEYARTSTQEAPYEGIDKGSLLREVFEGKRKGRFNVAIESTQVSPLTGKERKVTESIDFSAKDLQGYGSRLISTNDTDIMEPMQRQQFTVQPQQMVAPMIQQQPQQRRPDLFGVGGLVDKEVAFSQSLKKPSSNPYDIFGMDEFVKQDVSRQHQAMGGGMGMMGSGFVDSGRQNSPMMNDFMAGMNYSTGSSNRQDVAPRDMFNMRQERTKSNFDMMQENAIMRSNLADSAVMRKGLLEEANYVRSQRQQEEFGAGMPVKTGMSDYLFGAKIKVDKPAYTETYYDEKGKRRTRKVEAQKGVVERYGGALGAAKATYEVGKPMLQDTYKVGKAAYKGAVPIVKGTYNTIKPVGVKIAKSTDAFLSTKIDFTPAVKSTKSFLDKKVDFTPYVQGAKSFMSNVKSKFTNRTNTNRETPMKPVSEKELTDVGAVLDAAVKETNKGL